MKYSGEAGRCDTMASIRPLPWLVVFREPFVKDSFDACRPRP
jgi:hypothetical protein